jgi:pSer/pThr/pTyr-binding forkhead associated (FHA) protein
VGLLPSELNTTQKMDASHLVVAADRRWEPPSAQVALTDNWVTLHLLDTGEVMPLSERNEFTLGRATDGQPVLPDVDLAPYQAYTHGVSRLHAVIKRGVDDISLMDLESANGTFINGKRLEPNEEHSLANGDVVALGGLKIQVLLKSM